MGKEIVYCVGCGTGLYEDDFRRGRAVMVNDRPYCSAHGLAGAAKPAPPPPKPTPSPVAIPRPESTRTRKPATSRIPLATAPPPPRRPAPPAQPESSSNTMLIVGGIVVAVVIVMVIFVMGGSSREPARSSYPPPDERPAPRLPVVRETPPSRRPDNPGPLPTADVLRELERNVQNKNPDEVLTLCERARPALKGSPQEDRLRQIEEQARYTKVEPAINRIRGITQADPAFKRRGEVLREIASALASAGGKSVDIDRLKTDYDRSYEEAATRQADATRADAERLSSEKKVDEAIRKCDEFLAVFAASGEGDSIRKLRTELESKKNQ